MKQFLLKLQPFFIFVLFGSLPFQSQISKPFDALSRRIIPSDLLIPHFFYKQIFFYPSDILILFFVGITLYTARHHLREFFFQGPSKYLLSLFLCCFLSIVCCASPHYSIHYYRLLQLGVFVLFFLAFKFFLSRLQSPLSFFREFFLVILASSLVQAGIAITQFFTKASLGVKFLGEENVQLFAFLRRGHEILRLRPSGSFTHPNILGCFLFFALLTTFYLLLSETKRFKQILLSGAILIQMGALVLTVSRSAIFAYFLSGILFLVLSLRIKLFPVKKLMIACSPIIASLLISCILFYPQIKAKGGFINYNSLARSYDQERMIYQKMAWKMHQDFPILGIGFNHYQLISQSYQPKDYTSPLYSKVHNIFLLVLAETGILGLSSFLLFLCAVLKITPQEQLYYYFKNRRQTTKLSHYKSSHQYGLLSLLMSSIFAGLIFISICDFFLWDLQHGRLLFLGTCAILAAHRIPLKESKSVLTYEKSSLR